MGKIEIFIPGQIPSLKNSKIMGKYPSKTVQKWLRTFGIQSYNSNRKEVKYFKRIPKLYDLEKLLSPLREYKDYPIMLGFHFVRKTKGSWDFNNANHIITDLMTAMDIIPDDNINYILPFPAKRNGRYWSYDKDNPGVWLEILNND